MDGEIGFAIPAVPDVSDPSTEPWGDLLVTYLAVAEKPGLRFLRRSFHRSERRNGQRLYRHNGVWAVMRNGFIIFASKPEILVSIDDGARFRASALYQDLVRASPDRVAILAGLATNVFAESLLPMIGEDHDQSMTRLGIEFFDALGSVMMWGRVAGSQLEGCFSLSPELGGDERIDESSLSNHLEYSGASIPVVELDGTFPDSLVSELEIRTGD